MGNVNKFNNSNLVLDSFPPNKLIQSYFKTLRNKRQQKLNNNLYNFLQKNKSG